MRRRPSQRSRGRTSGLGGSGALLGPSARRSASFELISVVEKTAKRMDGVSTVLLDYSVAAHAALEPILEADVPDRYAFLRALRSRANVTSTCSVIRAYLGRSYSSDPKEVLVSCMVRLSDASDVGLALAFRVGNQTVAERRCSVMVGRHERGQGGCVCVCVVGRLAGIRSAIVVWMWFDVV